MLNDKLLEEINKTLVSFGFQNGNNEYHSETEYCFYDKTWNPENGGAKYMVLINSEHESLNVRNISDPNFYMGKSVVSLQGKKITIKNLEKKIIKL